MYTSSLTPLLHLSNLHSVVSVHKQNYGAWEPTIVRSLPFFSSVILQISHFQIQVSHGNQHTGEHSCLPGVYTDKPSQGERNYKQEAGASEPLLQNTASLTFWIVHFTER